ncbi:MAG: flagellar hook-basal body complex protein [Pirellulales bacterium]|nr:flagellar hook-basal body complex protein [Pirellulales bacterium]
MGLASALSTALTGLTAAETTIDVVGNNLANSNTVGFKASEATFATQFLQTLSLGSKPTANNGGTNPRQTGLGTMVADITPDFGQGTIEISANPTDMAIQGDGFFIVQGGGGEQLYTRNGIFKLNADNELTTITGNRVLGYGIDSQFNIERTQLVPIEINLGGSEVAEATQNVYLEGTLTPQGEVANTAEIIKSTILGDASYSQPAGTATSGASVAPDVVAAGTTPVLNGAGVVDAGDHYYKIVYGDGDGSLPTVPESLASVALPVITVPVGGATVDVTPLPVNLTPGSTCTVRVYRTVAGATANGPYYYVGDEVNGAVTFQDNMDDATLITQPQLNTDTLTGNYTYYVTFIDAAGIESRPSPAIVQNISNGRVELRDLPVRALVDNNWVSRKIYRNTVNNPNTWYDLGITLSDATTAGVNFTDNTQDAVIELNSTLDFDGPKITPNTLLTNVISRDGSTYTNLFQAGTLDFTGQKGGRNLGEQEFTIDATTIVGDMVTFMTEAMGIISGPTIPVDAGTGLAPGGMVDAATGQIVFVSNNGEDNAVDIPLSGLKLTPTGSSTPDTVNLSFSTTQEAIGQGAVTDFIAYDSLGMAVQVRLTAVMQDRTNTETIYRWFADSPDNQPNVGEYDINVGTGLIYFDGEGNFVSATNSTVEIERRDVPSASPLEFDLDFTQLSGLAAEDASLAVARQDGSGPGTLTSFIVGEDGTIRGVFSNGITRDLGQIRLARFGNPSGLEQKGENMYAAGVNSGLPVEGDPGSQGIGTIIAGATELSNTDIGKNLIDLILASTMYRGNTRVITTSQQLFDELLALRR